MKQTQALVIGVFRLASSVPNEPRCSVDHCEEVTNGLAMVVKGVAVCWTQPEPVAVVRAARPVIARSTATVRTAFEHFPIDFNGYRRTVCRFWGRNSRLSTHVVALSGRLTHPSILPRVRRPSIPATLDHRSRPDRGELTRLGNFVIDLEHRCADSCSEPLGRGLPLAPEPVGPMQGPVVRGGGAPEPFQAARRGRQRARLG